MFVFERETNIVSRYLIHLKSPPNGYKKLEHKTTRGLLIKQYSGGGPI